MRKSPPGAATKKNLRARFFEAAHANSNVTVGDRDCHGHVRLQNGTRVVVVSAAANGPCCFFSFGTDQVIPPQDPKTYRQAAEFLGLDVNL